ncbi:Protein of uncharacterised function (DUF2804) [Slackia heliotrinireducens]|jgi:hypothetical protein|uniref:DUF2804 domain-containing protein n=1 Tax=Slackia heliotrinireducens (strain ATCC 29202 / DSM 20476 / NCTC 11029 / RHS 1) TaxID=471855 RepID=C7N128_SLAHD|nr:DUF2804 domain-containing protein [Slackia heliotrinireducens]ACV23250.1 hypothetical protein Shel_22400 [Slackia heliotrinireducens DSM 20476]VEH02393.1 Protein of uncharacterised function (DUF2804) [Slackia heliotrinireducens]
MRVEKNARGETRIVEPGPLLDDEGKLAVAGYATQPLLRYDRSKVAANPLRLKEWDYYLVYDADFALALTIADLGYVGMVSASVVDLRNATFVTTSELAVLPLGRMRLPHSSDRGVTAFSNNRVTMGFTVADGLRHLSVEFERFNGDETLTAEMVLDKEPADSMNIATPWEGRPKAFYYNRKIPAMRVMGGFNLGPIDHTFEPTTAHGLLDWGRGVWTYDNMWYWSAAQGKLDGHVFGMNLGYGFGDTSAASENMVFVDGIAHKLGRVDFGIPKKPCWDTARMVGDAYDLMKPWRFTDDEGRLDLVFTPILDRCDLMDFKAVVTDQHQVFGRFDGTVVLDDGSVFDVRQLIGFAEAVHNKY